MALANLAGLNYALPVVDRATPMQASTFLDWYSVTLDRKSTRLNSGHLVISYAAFCLKKRQQPKPSPRSGATQLSRHQLSPHPPHPHRHPPPPWRSLPDSAGGLPQVWLFFFFLRPRRPPRPPLFPPPGLFP